jgi:peptide/nickel transport system permease protein
MLHQLKKSKLFLGGAILCGILVIVGVLGYAITEDPTPNANQIVPEWSNLGPGTTVYYSQESSPESTPSYLYWALGNPNTPRIIPFQGKLGQQNKPEYHSRTFWLGSDRFGRDILSRMIIGARISLSIGFFAMIASLLIGVIIGISSGYYGGKIDAFFSWLITVFWSVPTLLIALGLSMVFGKGYYQVLLATALSTWVEVARVVRGQTLQLKQREFILAAKITGFSNARIMFKHILPNLKGSLTVLATTNFASAILLEAGLGFLGLGVAPPTPSWGMMVKENLGYLVLDNSYLALVPGIAIMILVMAFNLMSMGLRDALDPYTKDS